MDQREIKKFKDLIDSFDTGYYQERIENLEKEINNISMGRPRLEGIRSYGNNKIVPKHEREKEINKLRKEIRTIREDLKDYRYVLSQLRTSADQLEALAEKKVLLNYFKSTIASREYSQMEITDVYEQNKDKYIRLYSKSTDKIGIDRRKISKDLYKMIKKNKGLRVHQVYERYESIESAFKYNKTNLVNMDKYSPGNRIFGDVQDKYINSLEPLGVDVNRINHAKEQMKGEPTPYSLTWHANDSFDKLKAMKHFEEKGYNIKGGYSALRELEKKYEEIIEFSRECWFIEEVLQAFKDTDIVDTEMYKVLQELNRNNKEELMNLVNKTDKMFENSEISSKIALEAKLQELYRQTRELTEKVEEYEKMGNYKQSDFVKTDYFNLRYEMIKILKEHPELNRTEYDIDIESIIKKEKELYEPEIKNMINKEEKVSETNVVEEEVISQQTAVEEMPVHIQTKEEKFVEKAYIEESGKIESLELDSSLQIFRTMHYQGYMREKVLNSDLGKLSFSAYLESVAPHLTELINIEKERERLARTIYKDYLNYYSSLENKKDAIEFYEFAGNNYGISNVDVPIEHDEEYKGMMRK